MIGRKAVLNACYFIMLGVIGTQGGLSAMAQAQYYPPTTTYPPPATGYPTTAPATYPPTTYPPPTTAPGYGYPLQGSATYTAPATTPPTYYPPATTTPTYYPPTATPTYTMPTTTAPTTWGTPAYTTTGLKFTYNPNAGDYYSLQAPNAGRWEQFPITFHLTYSQGMSQADQQAVRDAVAEWQKYVNIVLVPDPRQASIELTWVTNVSNSELGETQVVATQTDSVGRIAFQKEVIRMQDPASYVGVVSGALKSALMHQIGHALGINAHSDNNQDLMAEPNYQQVKNAFIQNAVRSLASRTIGQFIGLPVYQPPTVKQYLGPPIQTISQRDLNTLFRLYNS